MFRKTNSKNTLSRLRHAVCAFGLLLSLAALPAYGQQIHQLSYNGSSWSDQNLGSALAEQWAISAFFTTPNDQLHVFYGAHVSEDLHQLFDNGSNWADLDLKQAVDLCKYCGIGGFSVANFQYVFYVGGDACVHQMLYNNAGWVDTNLSIASGTSAIPDLGSNLVAFTTSPAPARLLHQCRLPRSPTLRHQWDQLAGRGSDSSYRRSGRDPGLRHGWI